MDLALILAVKRAQTCPLTFKMTLFKFNSRIRRGEYRGRVKIGEMNVTNVSPTGSPRGSSSASIHMTSAIVGITRCYLKKKLRKINHKLIRCVSQAKTLAHRKIAGVLAVMN